MSSLNKTQKSTNKPIKNARPQITSKRQTFAQSTIITVVGYVTIAVITVTALIMTSGGKINVNFPKFGLSITIEQQQQP